MAQQQGTIRFRNEDGEYREVSWDTWISEILPDEFRKAWHDADRLYHLLHSTMRDGLFDTLLPAAERLHQIDTNRLRSTAIYAAALIHSDHLQTADTILGQHLEQHGPSADVLYQRAILHEKRSKHTMAEETLRQALQVDPNHEEALDWWAAIQRLQGGETSYVHALEQLAQAENAWRASVHIARHNLESGRLSQALQQYEQAIARFSQEPAIPMLASFDLGNLGFPEALIKLLAGRYHPRQDDPLTGINILQAYIVLDRFGEAEQLLETMIHLDEPEIYDDLMRFARQIRKRRQGPT